MRNETTPEDAALESIVREDDALTRVQIYEPSGVPQLDLILGGGLPRGALTLIMGVPGSGKTSLASQIAFAAARRGQTVLILTALSESTGKLIEHLRAFSFFDQAAIGGRVQFLSLQQDLMHGLPATRDAVLAMARRIRAGMVVLDGFRGMREVERDPSAAREFLYDVGTTLGTLGTTTLVTSETDPHDPTFFPETTTADVILGLHFGLIGNRQQRTIEVVKVRGAAPLPGLHAVTVSQEGLHIYPQLEERVAATVLGSDPQTQGAAPLVDETRLIMGFESALTAVQKRVAFGLPELDALLQGGVVPKTTTVLAGSLGTGKTLLALHYALAGARAGQQSVYLSFREDPYQLVRSAAPFAIGREIVDAQRPGGNLSFIWAPPIKLQPDVIADRILSTLNRVGPCRLVIDSVAELERAVTHSGDPDRLEDYLAALLEVFKAGDVTALLVKETTRIGAATLDFSVDPLSVLAENVVLLQHVPYRGRLHRMLSVLKLRYSDHDTSLREFVITPPSGIRVLAPLESGTDILERIAADQTEQAQYTSHGEGRERHTPLGGSAKPRDGASGRTAARQREPRRDIEQGTER